MSGEVGTVEWESRRADRAEASAAAAIQEMDRKLKEIELRMWAIVAAAGGMVSVPRCLLTKIDISSRMITHDEATDCVRFKITI